MSSRFRACKNCEWMRSGRYMQPHIDGACCLEPTTIEKSNDGFCANWEPRWHDNPKIKKQWEKFKTSLVMQMDHKDGTSK